MGEANFNKLRAETFYIAVNFDYIDDTSREIGYAIGDESGK